MWLTQKIQVVDIDKNERYLLQNKEEEIAVLIITGTGRSGTGSMAKLLGGYHEFRVHYLLDKYFKH
ncbi:MAG: hypothetical protein H6Q93_331, partial [Nitrospirae bacterium]|nr:hypothetical protein [Nitrospirota bacterium]